MSSFFDKFKVGMIGIPVRKALELIHGNTSKTTLANATDIATNVSDIADNAGSIATLSGLLGGYKIVSCSIEVAANAAAATEVTLTGALATDVAIAIAADLSNGSATFLQSAVAGVNKVDVTFDGNTATGDKFNLLVLRPGA